MKDSQSEQMDKALDSSGIEKSVILDALAEVVFYQDLNLCIIWGNRKAAEVMNTPPEELKGRLCYEVYCKAKKPCEDCLAQKALSTKKSCEKEIIDDSGAFWRISVYPVLDENKEVKGFVHLSKDITSRKEAEEKKQKINERLQYAQKLESLGLLARNVAHDFNNQLQVILGNATMLLMDNRAASMDIQCIKAVEKAARRASSLAHQMLTYSGMGKLCLETLNLNTLIKGMNHLIDSLVSKKAVIKYSLTEDTPIIKGDAAQIRQIIINLITNASDALNHETGIIQISTGIKQCSKTYLQNETSSSALKPGAYAFIEVKDTGCGMDKNTLSKVFDPFFTTKFTGRGMGLAAVLGIINSHHGLIKTQSKPGKGASMRVLIPICSDGALTHSEQYQASPNIKTWQGEGVVLVVDDEESVRHVAESMLRRAGFSPITANDGREAIDVLESQRHNIECILLDYEMPYLDGAETYSELMAIKKDIPVILCSGYDLSSIEDKFSGHRPAGFIQKPYLYKKLITMLKDVMEKK